MPDGAKKELLSGMVKKAEFMHEELTKLQDILREKGWVEEYQNGEHQRGFKKSSECDIYNQLIRSYSVIMQKVLDALPDDVKPKDAFDEFMKKWGNAG